MYHSHRERIIELVLCGAEDWHSNLKRRQESHQDSNTGVTRSESGVFGSSSNRFNGLPGGALNGGGVHSHRPISKSASTSKSGPSGSFIVGAPVNTHKVSVLPHGWTYVVELQLLSKEMAELMEEELDDVLGTSV